MSVPSGPFVYNRRAFLRDASVLTVTVSSLSNSGFPALAQKPASSNQVRPIDLGVEPTMSGPGGVAVRKPNSLFLLFPGVQYDAEGAISDEGSVVIQFERCLDWKFRIPGDEGYAQHPVDINALDFCKTYEVENSTWSAAIQELVGAPDDRPPKHYIVTFLGLNPGILNGTMNFECLAVNATAHCFGDASFQEISLMLDGLDANGT